MEKYFLYLSYYNFEIDIHIMKLVFMLPDDLIDHIFEYYDPYKSIHEQILYELRWNQFWYHCFCNWFVKQNLDYPTYVLNQNNSKSGNYLRI